jgi:hypothetical protein
LLNSLKEYSIPRYDFKFFGGLQDLQEQIDLINPVDTHLINQVSQLRKADEPKKNVSYARAVRQEYTQGKGAIGKIVQIETEEKGVGF